MAMLECEITDETAERLREVERRLGWNPKEVLGRVLRAGLFVTEMEIQRSERICCRCRNADGDEQGGHGDWYCRRCWKVVTSPP